jgi:hypothetical protein
MTELRTRVYLDLSPNRRNVGWLEKVDNRYVSPYKDKGPWWQLAYYQPGYSSQYLRVCLFSSETGQEYGDVMKNWEPT